MKLFISLITLTALSLNAYAVDRDVEITCKLSPAQSPTVDSVMLSATKDLIKLQYRNGSSEVVKPVEAKNLGLFGTENFTADLVWNNGQVFAPKTAVGPIYIRFACFLTPTIFFERCISQGTHETAKFSAVRMNLHGKPLVFIGNNICSRVDRSAR